MAVYHLAKLLLGTQTSLSLPWYQTIFTPTLESYLLQWIM